MKLLSNKGDESAEKSNRFVFCFALFVFDTLCQTEIKLNFLIAYQRVKMIQISIDKCYQ